MIVEFWKQYKIRFCPTFHFFITKCIHEKCIPFMVYNVVPGNLYAFYVRLCSVLFCLVDVVSRCFLPVVYRRGVRYSWCPSLWLFTSFLTWFDCCIPFPPPSFYPVVLALALSSYLGCLAPFIYVYGCLSCPTHIICGCPGLFCFCSLIFPLLNPSLAMMSSAGYFHARFLLSTLFSFLFRPCSSPICFGVTSSILWPQMDS